MTRPYAGTDRLARALLWRPPYWLRAALDALWILACLYQAVRSALWLVPEHGVPFHSWTGTWADENIAALLPLWAVLIAATVRKMVGERRERQLRVVREVMDS